MRYAIFAVLVAVPLALIGWIGWRGKQAPPPELLPPAKVAPKGPDQILQELFQGPLGGAKVKDKVALYDQQGLFDYIDGGAPAFIEKHFRKLAAAEMAFEKGELTCDVYDMSAPENAVAIFNSEKGPSAKPVEGWPEAVTGPMSFVFHSGRFYVKLTAFDSSAEGGLPGLAKALKARMP